MGYPDAGLSSAVIDAHEFGVPQTRRRHFLVASRDCAFDICNGLAPVRSNGATLRDFIGDLVEVNRSAGIFDSPSAMSEINKKRASHLYRNGLYDLENARRPPCHRDKDHSYKSVYGRLRWEQPAQTITSGFGSMGQGRFLHPSAVRVITPHEAARLQGFPDFYDFSQAKKRTALHEMIGNAVIPRVAAVIVWSLLDASDAGRD
jgi:DNA (cytosine-5)-methyltransferase 1